MSFRPLDRPNEWPREVEEYELFPVSIIPQYLNIRWIYLAILLLRPSVQLTHQHFLLPVYLQDAGTTLNRLRPSLLRFELAKFLLVRSTSYMHKHTCVIYLAIV